MVEFRKVIDRGKRSARMRRGRLPEEEIREQPPGEAFREQPPGDREQDLDQAPLSFRLRDQVHAESEAEFRDDQAAVEKREGLYIQLAEYLKMAFNAVRADKPFSLQPGFKILAKIIDTRAPSDALFLKAIHDEDPYDLMISPSINVAIYAVKMAANLGFSKTRQSEIGMVALLHDIGMAKIPEALVYKQNLTADEFLVFKERPKYGYDILQAFKIEYAYLAECALQIHERLDGSGYPLGLAGDEIHEYAQIVGLADVYEALVHARPQREKILHFYAVKEVIKTGKDKFEHRFLKALLNTFSIFPLNTYIRLNSGAIGRVTRTYPDQPMRPKVQVSYDSQGKRALTERFINLPENSLLYIVDAVSEQEVIDLAEDSYLVTKPGRRQSALTETEAVPETHPAIDVPDEAKSKVAKTIARLTKARSAKPKNTLRKKSLFILAVILLAAGIAWQLLGDMFANGNDQWVAETTAQVLEPVKIGSPEKKVILPQKAPPRVATKGKQPAKTVGVTAEKTVIDEVRSQVSTVQQAGVPTGNINKPVGKPGAVEAKTGAGATVTRPLSDFEKGTPDVSRSPKIGLPEAGRYPYSILLAHYRILSEAKAEIAEYKARGIDPYWTKIDLGEDGVWFRIFNGNYSDRAQARMAIKKFNLEGAFVKRTRYATWVAGFADRRALAQKRAELTDMGFSPYVIQDDEGTGQLYVGAFYTAEGAQDQYASLKKAGVDSRIVER